MKAFLIRLCRFYKKLGNYIFVPDDDKAFGKHDHQSNLNTIPKSGLENTPAEILKDCSGNLQQNASPVCYATDPEVRDEYKIEIGDKSQR